MNECPDHGTDFAEGRRFGCVWCAALEDTGAIRTYVEELLKGNGLYVSTLRAIAFWPDDKRDARQLAKDALKGRVYER